MVLTVNSPPDLSTFTGVTLLRMVATALVDLSRHDRSPDPIYSDKVQKAYNHLVLQCLLREMEPPASVAGMARWAATRPIGQWPFDLPAEAENLDEYLVDAQTGVPTQRCYEWEVSGPDAAAELFENEIIRTVFAQCETARSPQSYTAFRRLLIDKPVLTGIDKATLIGEHPELGTVLETVNRCYEPAPAAYRGTDGRFATCARCHCLLKPDGRSWRCELDRCRREAHATPKEFIDDRSTGGLYLLRAPLRMFITGPGLAEVELEQKLIGKGLVPEMWPGCDAYDLRITLPNRQVWAIDVKDRANPALLGHSATRFRPEPPYNRAFLVVPQYRFDDREDYKIVFEHFCPPEVKEQVTLLSDKAFLRMLTTTLTRLRKNGSAGGDDA
ncbi:HU-CCDC81 and SPOR domain-containing protein [Micromonospora aurantiaca (nom. illeg.)]|uniref:pPIWI_RE_Y domain-containing protein n=1 Tax=Micromonospora aurantiaca (nom. illeg.) TaxID=47850 RepID=UPI0001BF172C|nr:HU-CCDC81 and SPOR domain-containing protein [Micromonospora aurantiaca]ADL46100.1 hypothetical protein Micau_2561 [Micromonospora aurantiaca ATCC 27029]